MVKRTVRTGPRPGWTTRLGLALRQARVASGLSLAQAGELSGLTFSQVSALERAAKPEPAFRTVVRLAVALGMSLEDLVAYAGFGDRCPPVRLADASKRVRVLGREMRLLLGAIRVAVERAECQSKV